MKVWERNKPVLYDHPDDMEKILNYLTENGKLYVSGQTVEKLYREFSDRACASWLIVSDEWLEEFADWLEEQFV